MAKARAILPNIAYVDDMNAVAEGCDALVVATEWDEFKKLDLERAKKCSRIPSCLTAAICLIAPKWNVWVGLKKCRPLKIQLMSLPR